jgi:diadenosine tetraphosphate (Ap4A) HIT family hydrolase
VTADANSCPLCSDVAGELLWQSPRCRIVRVADAEYPDFCRVIWTAHIKEMTDLQPEDRQYMMVVVLTVEEVLRRLLSPDKINLASFGNVVPHLHWHVIPRWKDDKHFPEPVWGTVQRDCPPPSRRIDSLTLAAALSHILEVRLAKLAG